MEELRAAVLAQINDAVIEDTYEAQVKSADNIMELFKEYEANK